MPLDRATAQVTATVNAKQETSKQETSKQETSKQETSKQETSKLRFLKVDGDWKVRFESR